MKTVTDATTIELAESDAFQGFSNRKSRTVMVNGEIDTELAGVFCDQLLELESLSNTDPIYVHINTLGGSVTDAVAMYDTMRMIDAPIVTVVKGICSSAGNLILAGGDHRLATRNSMFFYHQVQLGLFSASSGEDLAATNNLYEISTVMLHNELRTRFDIPEAEWEKQFGKRFARWFTAKEALEAGWVHEIIEPKTKQIKK